METDNSVTPVINFEFLTSTLGNEVEIVSYEISPGSKPGDNYMSLIYSIDVQLKRKNLEDSVETRHLLLKCYPTHPSRQDFNNQMNLFHRELQFYQVWLPELARFQKEVIGLQHPVPLPFTHVVAGKCIDYFKPDATVVGKPSNPLDNFIMMNDLRKTLGLKLPDKRRPLDIHHIRLVISAVAKLHAISWAYKNLVAQDIPGKYSFLRLHLPDKAIESWGIAMLANMDEELKSIEKAFGPTSPITKGAKNFKQYMMPLLKASRFEYVEQLCQEAMRVENHINETIPEPWLVISHGDCWSSNMLFRYDSGTGQPVEVTLVDLQLTCQGSITLDLIQSIYSSTNTELRKKHLDELLHLYMDTFNQLCRTCKSPSLPGFTFEAFKARFHRAKALGCMFGLMMYPLMLREEDTAIDLETIDSSNDFGELLQQAVGGSGIMNSLVTQRVLELVQEMYDEGII